MKKIYILATAALALASCSSDDNYPVEESVALQVSATIDQSNMSRAADTEWAKGDRIGISSTVGTDGVGDKEPYINVPYTTDGDGTFTGEPIFFYNKMTLTAYYPFDGENGKGKVPGVNGVISATTSADNQTAENQPSIDFLWDTKTGGSDFNASNPEVNFDFAHKMSKISFVFQSSKPVYDKRDPTIQLSDGVDVRNMVSYEIIGLGTKGTFNTANGECALDGEERSGLKMIYAKENIELAEEEKWDYKRQFPSLIVFPQDKPENDDFELHLVTDELDDEGNLQKYNCALRFNEGKIKPGCHYRFTVKVTKIGLIVGDLTIDPWEDGEERSLTATIDGENPFKNQSSQTTE